MSRVRSWYKNKTEVSNCGKCFYWCDVKECELEQQYRKLNKIVPASHAPCEKYKHYKGEQNSLLAYISCLNKNAASIIDVDVKSWDHRLDEITEKIRLARLKQANIRHKMQRCSHE